MTCVTCSINLHFFHFTIRLSREMIALQLIIEKSIILLPCYNLLQTSQIILIFTVIYCIVEAVYCGHFDIVAAAHVN